MLEWCRRHVIALALTFLTLFTVVAVAIGNYEIRSAQERFRLRDCEILKRSVDHTNAEIIAVITFYRDLALAAGRDVDDAFKRVEEIVTNTDPIYC